MNQTDIASILGDYTKLILAISDNDDPDPIWQRFYQLQMTSYFLSKKDFKFRLEEALKAYDMIVKTWDDLREYIETPVFPIRDLDNILMHTFIDFPVDELSITEENNNDVLIYGSI